MRIKIGTRLIAAFILVVLLMVAMTLYSVTISQKSLRESVGKSSIFLAQEMLKRMNHDVYLKIEKLQTHSSNLFLQNSLTESNSEFERLDSVEEYLSQKDREWVSAPKDERTPLMQELISNELSDSLRREFIEFYEKKYGYKVFEEVFVTNKYGANVVQTGKTSDYRQDDEQWWQIAKGKGFYVGDVYYDESTEIHAVDIGVGVDDEEGNFIGVIKAALDIKRIIREAEILTGRFETTEIKLITKDGRLIYATEVFRFLEDVSEKAFFKKIRGESDFFIGEEGGIEKLYSYARSKGYRDFEGLGWILVMGHDVEEVLEPAFILRKRMVAVSLILIAIGIIIAFFMSFSITKPIAKLTQGAEIIGKGDLEHRVELKTKDEIGELAVAFNQMTERRQRAEEELRRREKEMNLIADNVPALFSYVGADGRYRFINKRYEEWFGIPRTGIIGKHYREVLGEASYELIKDRVDSVLSGHRVCYEEALPYIHGGTRWVIADYVPDADERGKVKGFFALITDITERKRAEEELKKYHEHLEESVAERTAELESFAYSISHDLSAPLRAMQGFAQALQEDYTGQLDPVGKDYANRIVAAAQRMDALIQDLLDYSRLSRAQIQLQMVNLVHVTKEVLKQLESEIRDKDAQVTVEGPLPEVQGHYVTLVQVVSNLLTNALKFVAPGARPQVRVWADEQDELVRLWVEDNGIGIAPEYHERIFHIFERLHGVETYPGTGVGLAIVKKAIDRMGGRLGVESKVGEGSKFWLELDKGSWNHEKTLYHPTG